MPQNELKKGEIAPGAPKWRAQNFGNLKISRNSNFESV